MIMQAVNKLENNAFYWPDTEERQQLEVDDLPVCIAFMDETDIKLEDAPCMDRESYYDKVCVILLLTYLPTTTNMY